MHILSGKHREEFTKVPMLVRFTLSQVGKEIKEPSLLIKATSLSIKYLIRKNGFSLSFFLIKPENQLLYVIEINDDSSPCYLWSLTETEEELEAIKKFLKAKCCPVFIFNETVVNVCWSEIDFVINPEDAHDVIKEKINHCSSESSETHQRVATFLDNQISKDQFGSRIISALPKSSYEWNNIKNIYITNQGNSSEQSILTGNEGDQQEELAVWLSDSLCFSGAIKNPQVEEDKGVRELSDVLLSYEGGCFIFESKVLSIFDKEDLPDREKLAKNLSKSIKKATKQLSGACKNIKCGKKITNENGEEINLDRDKPIHCFVLIPDLSIIGDKSEFGQVWIKSFLQKTESLLHIVDMNFLMGLILNANYLVGKGSNSLIESFDRVLWARWEKSLELDTPNFKVNVRFNS